MRFVHRAATAFVLIGVFATSFGAPQYVAAQYDGKSIEELVQLLSGEDINARRDAAYELFQRGPGAKDAIPALIKAVDDREQQVWFHSMQTIARIGPDGHAAIPVLIQALDGRDAQRRYRAAYALGRIGPAAIPALLEALKNGSATARAEAVKSIGFMNSAASRAVPSLIRALADESPTVRDQAIDALGRLAVRRKPRSSARWIIPRWSFAPARRRPCSKLSRDPSLRLRLYYESWPMRTPQFAPVP